MKMRRSPFGQRGQTVVEACVVIAVFGVFLLGVFQMILLYRAKSLLDYAAQEAARSGATNGAQLSAMQVGLARGLMPLYSFQPSNTQLVTAYENARVDTLNPLVTEIQVLNPTKAAFNDFKEAQFDGVQAIPNDSLPYRSQTVGASSGMNIQDANVLKIRVVYGYKLIVPVISSIIITLMETASGSSLDVKQEEMLADGRLPIVAQAIVRMQSPIRNTSALP